MDKCKCGGRKGVAMGEKVQPNMFKDTATGKFKCGGLVKSKPIKKACGGKVKK